MTREKAVVIARLIETLEERVNHQSVVEEMAKEGYSFDEVDQALRALGELAKYDISWS